MRFDAHEGKRMFNKRLTPASFKPSASGWRQPAASGQKKSRG
jgi:hypothetical protein